MPGRPGVFQQCSDRVLERSLSILCFFGSEHPGSCSGWFCAEVLEGKLGDCNGDGLVDAADISSFVLEIFDGDNTDPALTPGGTFKGNPVGCNPNQDYVVDAGDLSCTILIIQAQGTGSTAACAGGTTASAFTKAFAPMSKADTEGLVVLDLPDFTRAWIARYDGAAPHHFQI